MTDLETWLPAQILELEQLALSVPADMRSHEWSHPGRFIVDGHPGGDQGNVLAHVNAPGALGELIAEYIGARSPRDVLAQCDAHRRLLKPHHLVHDEEFGGLYCQGCGLNVLGRLRTPRSLKHCPTWRGVALAYRHRPGWREEWRA